MSINTIFCPKVSNVYVNIFTDKYSICILWNASLMNFTSIQLNHIPSPQKTHRLSSVILSKTTLSCIIIYLTTTIENVLYIDTAKWLKGTDIG